MLELMDAMAICIRAKQTGGQVDETHNQTRCAMRAARYEASYDSMPHAGDEHSMDG